MEKFNTNDPLMKKIYKNAQKRVDEKWKDEQYVGHMKEELLEEMYNQLKINSKNKTEQEVEPFIIDGN